MFSIMLAIWLYSLTMLIAFAFFALLLFLVSDVSSACKDIVYAIVGGQEAEASRGQDCTNSRSDQYKDIIQSLDGMSDEDARRYLKSKRDDLEDERQELAHLRLPTSFDPGFGYDAYRHQGLSRLNFVEYRISFIDCILEKDVA